MAKFTVLTDIVNTLRTWTNALRNLSFEDNFRGYEWEGEIPAGDTMKITHDLKIVPTKFIILNCQGSYPQLGTPGSPKATVSFFYLTNYSGSDTFVGRVLLLP